MTVEIEAMDAFNPAIDFLQSLTSLDRSYIIFFLIVGFVLICFRNHRRKLSTLQRQLAKLEHVVRELEAAENRRFCLSLRSPAPFEETPLAGPSAGASLETSAAANLNGQSETTSKPISRLIVSPPLNLT